MSNITKLPPTFFCTDRDTGQLINSKTVRYDNNTSVYSISGLPLVRVIISVSFHIRGSRSTFPGNYYVSKTVDIPNMSPDERVSFDIGLVQRIHMTSPWDNDAVNPLTYDPTSYPAAEFPEYSGSLNFAWDAVPGATQYQIKISLSRDPYDHPDGYGRVGYVVDESVQGTSFSIILAPSEDLYHYGAAIFAYGPDGDLLGDFHISYPSGHGWDYRFKVVERLPITETSLVGWWPFNEGSGTVANDLSGNGVEAALFGGPIWDEDIRHKGILLFDGFDDYVFIDGSYQLTLYTICVWFQADGGSGQRDIFSAYAPGVRHGILLELMGDGTLHYLHRYPLGLDGGINIYTSATYDDGAWYHATMVKSEEEIKLYINGEQVGSIADSRVFNDMDPLGIVLGKLDNEREPQRLFTGALDDVRIYNQALSYYDIQPIMQAEVWPYAWAPEPADGAIHGNTWVSLGWRAGDSAVSHDIYFGDNFDDVNNGVAGTFQGNQTTTTFTIGLPGGPYPDGLVLDTTYYWRIDEVEADGSTVHKGDVWSFTTVDNILSEALDSVLSFSTGGDEDWLSQTAIYYHDDDAAQSGGITDDQESWLQTSVNGAGTVSFFWKVSSEGNYDCLEFYIDGTLQDQISGSEDWHDMTYEITGSSSHILEWRYFKDGSMSRGDDCGWVDKVEWVIN
jgi:hypothetical protein